MLRMWVRLSERVRANEREQMSEIRASERSEWECCRGLSRLSPLLPYWVEIDCCFVLVAVVAVTVFAVVVAVLIVVVVVVVVTLFPHSYCVGSCCFLHRPISFSGQVMNMPLTQTQWHPTHTHTHIHSTFAHPHKHTKDSPWMAARLKNIFHQHEFPVRHFLCSFFLFFASTFLKLFGSLYYTYYRFILCRRFKLSNVLFRVASHLLSLFISLSLVHFAMMLFLSFLRRRGSCRTFSGNTWLKWGQLIGLGFHLLSLLTAQLLRHTGVLWVRGGVCVCVCIPFLIVSITLQRCFFLFGQILNS